MAKAAPKFNPNVALKRQSLTMSQSNTVRSLVDDHAEETSITVIQKLLEVFNPSQGLFDMVRAHGGPLEVIEHIMDKHHLDSALIVHMYEKQKFRYLKEVSRGDQPFQEPSSSSAGPKAVEPQTPAKKILKPQKSDGVLK